MSHFVVPGVSLDHSSLVDLLHQRRVRSATASVVSWAAIGLLLSALAVGLLDGAAVLLLLVFLPGLFSPLVGFTVRRLVKREGGAVERLARRARTLEPRSSAATMLLGALAPFGLIVLTTPLAYLAFAIALFVLVGAWIQPVLWTYAFLIARRWSRTPTDRLTASRPPTGPLSLLVLVAAVGTVVGLWNDVEVTAYVVTSATLQVVCFLVGLAVARRRLVRERAIVSAALEG